MESAYHNILEKEAVKPPKNTALAAAKKEDVELIVSPIPSRYKLRTEGQMLDPTVRDPTSKGSTNFG